MLNHIVIMGRLTRDPELRRTGSGVAVASFTVAVDRDFAQNGQKETDFLDCVAWRQTGEFVSKYFTKGRMIVVSGRLQIRSWTDKDGNKRKSAEIVADNCYFGDSKQSTEGGTAGSYGGQTGGYGSQSGHYSAPTPGINAYGSTYDAVLSGYPETQAEIDRLTGGQTFTPPPYPGNSYHQQDFSELTDDDEQLPF